MKKLISTSHTNWSLQTSYTYIPISYISTRVGLDVLFCLNAWTETWKRMSLMYSHSLGSWIKHHPNQIASKQTTAVVRIRDSCWTYIEWIGDRLSLRDQASHDPNLALGVKESNWCLQSDTQSEPHLWMTERVVSQSSMVDDRDGWKSECQRKSYQADLLRFQKSNFIQLENPILILNSDNSLICSIKLKQINFD